MKLQFSLTLIIYFSWLAIGIAQKENNAFQNTRVAFEQNKGQIKDMDNNPAPYVQYHYKQGNTNLFLLKTGIAYQFNRTHYPKGYKNLNAYSSPEEEAIQDNLQNQIRLETYRMDMQLVNANPNAAIITEGKSDDYINYYNHDVLDVHSFNKITYKDIYPNIDWVIYTTDNGLKYDFIVHVGGDPKQIQMKFDAHEDLAINKDGSFTLSNSMGSITEKAPISFQGKQTIATQFQLQENIIHFNVADYDPTQTLIIDPSLVWATYYGGNDSDAATGCITDNNDNIYIAGLSNSTSNIAILGHQNSFNGGAFDAMVVKFNANGIRQWATYYGGNDRDIGRTLAVFNNALFLTGYTESSTNIATTGAHQTIIGGDDDAFLVKFDTNGTRQWATYYGGIDQDQGRVCSIDNMGNIILGGTTQSSTGISFNGHQNTIGGGRDVFVVKFNTNGIRQWSTYYGGTGLEFMGGCTVDNNNNIFFSGSTASTTNIASAGSHQNTYGGGRDAFLVKINTNGVRQWSTYYGGIGRESMGGCTVDNNNNIVFSGTTASTTNIATNGIHQDTLAGADDAFLVKFNTNGVRQWGTYYGGTLSDNGLDITVDISNNIFITGGTSSSNGIAFNGHKNTYTGGDDVFLTKFNSNGLLQWGTYYGGGSYEYTYGCALDKKNNVYMVGETGSSTSIGFRGYQNSFQGGFGDAFLAKFQGDTCLPTTNNITRTTCDSFIYHGITYLSSGSYTAILTNTSGCDSVVTLNLTINTGSTSTDVQSACGSYTWIDGNTYTASNNSATDTLVNANGCDSIITLDLTILNPTTSTDVQSACGSYTWIDGNTYTTSNNTATFTLQNAAGCDSIITLDLNINVVDTAITINGTILSANAANASYQWIDCSNNTPILNMSNQIFEPTANGNYAVIVTENGCIDTSACIAITIVNIQEYMNNTNVILYPNPTDGAFTIAFDQVQESLHLRLFSITGQVIIEKHLEQVQRHTLEINQPSGVYLVEVANAKGDKVLMKVVKD